MIACGDASLDLIIVSLQGLNFLLKVQDSFAFLPILPDMLEWENRNQFYQNLYIAKNFLDFCILDTVALLFVAYRVIDILRIVQEVNTIVESLFQSTKILFIFLGAYLMINIILVPFA